MSTSQVSYFCIANLGDVNPFEHGGAFVCVDRRGIYDPILLLYKESDRSRHEITLERYHVITSNDKKTVGSNRFHVLYEEWFCDSLDAIASFADISRNRLIDNLVSNNPITRATAYMILVGYYGPEKFDSTPYIYEEEEKAEFFCNKMLQQIKESESWHDGYFRR